MASSLFSFSFSSRSFPSTRSDLLDLDRKGAGARAAAAKLRSIWVSKRRGSTFAPAGVRRYKGTAMREEALTEMIERKVAEAMEACAGEEAKASEGCRVAWDEVEEVSQAKADLRRRLADSPADPLEPFCQHNPDSDECRIYDDEEDYDNSSTDRHP